MSHREDRELRRIEHGQHTIEHELTAFERESLHLLKRILVILERENIHRYAIQIHQENIMAIGNITAGTTGTFAAQLTDNGSPIALPSGSSFAWSADDASITFDTSASPDGSSAVASVPAGDLGTTATITATATAPDGSTASGSIVVALTPVPQQFAVTVTQTA